MTHRLTRLPGLAAVVWMLVMIQVTKAESIELVGTANSYTSLEGVGLTSDRTKIMVMEKARNCIKLVENIEDANPVITIVAGIDTTTEAHVDGVGTAARFDSPNGLLYLFGAKVWYISERNGDTIRQMTEPNYEVTTVAGIHADNG